MKCCLSVNRRRKSDVHFYSMNDIEDPARYQDVVRFFHKINLIYHNKNHSLSLCFFPYH